MASRKDQEEVSCETMSGGPSLMSRMALNDNKAGMEGLDKEKINQIIYNASKGSKFYENEKKKEEQWNERIKEQQLLASRISSDKLREGQHQADLLLEKLVQQRDLSHTIVHVDMDAFYAAVEMRDNPVLKTKPMAVGGMGMLSTSNYLARKYGVRAAMPGFIGLKLCPELVMVKPNFEKYTAVSQEIRQVLAVYDPNFSPMSLDEAYLDLGPHLQYRASSPLCTRTFILRKPQESVSATDRLTSDRCCCDLNCLLLPAFLDLHEFSSSTISEEDLQTFIQDFDSSDPPSNIPRFCDECKKAFPNYCFKAYGRSVEEAVLEMRNRIEQRTFLTASAGIAANTMLAKVCSDKNKPNGQFRIPSDVFAVEEFVKDLPIRKICGIGKVTEKLLGAIGIVKCSDIYEKRALLYHLFSPTSFHHFMTIYLGMGSTVVERDDERKSMSTERTFSEISDKEELCSKCDEMSISLAQDLKDEHLKGKTVTLKIKCVSFEVRTRSQTLRKASSDPSVICSTARQLLLTEIKNARPAPLRLRLMGVRMSKLEPEEKRQVTVKDMFRKITATATSSVSNTQETSMNWDTDEKKNPINHEVLHKLSDTLGDRDQDDCVVISAASDSIPKECKGGPTNLRKGKEKGSKSSGNIMKFLSKDSAEKEQSICNLTSKRTPIFQTNQTSSGSDEFQVLVLERKDRDSVIEHQSDSFLPVSGSAPLGSQVKENLDTLTCPVCGVTEANWDLNSLNSHVDLCLSQQAIKEILHNEDKHAPSLVSASSLLKPDSQHSNKRLRPEKHTSQQNQDRPRKIQRTVISFFQK